MAKLAKRSFKYYTRTTKRGIRRIVMGYNQKGRWGIKKWEDADSLDMPHGEYKIKEWVINFIPTKDSRPSGTRNFEVRLRIPEGDYSINEIEEIAKEIMIDLTNEEFVDTSSIEWSKKGVDTIGYSNDEDTKWMVVDTARPQYKYPKERGKWGIYGEDVE